VPTGHVQVSGHSPRAVAEFVIFHLFGVLAQFERDLIRERTRAGLKGAEARGRKSGRKPTVTPDKLPRARLLIAGGLTVREAATRLKVGKSTLYSALGTSADSTEGLVLPPFA
jgi:DNA invertase Pin-like site-specific DNA recombinase